MGKWNEHVIYSEPLVKSKVRKKMIHIWKRKTKSMNIKTENDFEVQLIVLLIGILNPMSCSYKNLFIWFCMVIAWHSKPLGKRLLIWVPVWKSPVLKIVVTLFVYSPSLWQLGINVDMLNIYLAVLWILLILYVMYPFQYWKDILLLSLDYIAMFAV